MPGATLLSELDTLVDEVTAQALPVTVRTLCTLPAGARDLPLHAFTLGATDPGVPGIGIFGGVHGLERIGAEVVLTFLRSLMARLRWDALFRLQLARLRLVVVPVVNPVGLLHGTRANGQGVDLMRNAPVDAVERVPALLGGQRRGPWLPWYRGPAGAPMQPEAAAVCDLVETELFGRPFSLAVDCHSGFGLADRIWFPYAHTRAPFPRLGHVHALAAIFEATHRYHRYVFEPQSVQYLAHGDLWDHLALRAEARAGPGAFVPLTLEMGSWLWVKKNPRQLFSRDGMFNPRLTHRHQRVLRRHHALLDFMMRAVYGQAEWAPDTAAADALQRRRALDRWYGGAA